MQKSEGLILKEVMLSLSESGCLVFRNNTGKAWQGEVVRKDKDTITLRNYRFIHFGLQKGSSDLIGIKPVTITQDMVGQTIGVFIAPEIKSATGRATQQQNNFHLAVNRAGGLGFIARSADEALAALKQFTEA